MPFNADAFRKKLLNAVDKVMKEEQVHTEELLNRPVGYDAAGNVTVRSKPGEPPRRETGELQGNVFVQSALHPDRIESILSVSRPSTPDVPRQLQDDMFRPILRGSNGSIVRLVETAAERIAAKFNGS
jgi:hypothetical protein